MKRTLTSALLCAMLLVVGCGLSTPTTPTQYKIVHADSLTWDEELGGTYRSTEVPHYLWAWTPPTGGSDVHHYRAEVDWYYDDHWPDFTMDYIMGEVCIVYKDQAQDNCVRIRVRGVDVQHRTGPWSEWSEWACDGMKTPKYNLKEE